eukprot:15254887-Heterocapsa_arctica.AAC.1
MAKPQAVPKARPPATRPPMPVPAEAPPGNFQDPLDPNNPVYINFPGGPNVTVEQLRALRFSEADYERLRTGGAGHGFLWCPEFAEDFAEHCRRRLEAGGFPTPEFEAHCRRRLEEEGCIEPEAQYCDRAAPA